MKKLIALLAVCALLALCLVFPLRGASPASPAETETAAPPVTTEAPTVPTTTEAPPPAPVGLVEVTGLELSEEDGFFGLYAAEGMGYVLLCRWDAQAQVLRYRLAALDPATAAAVSVTALDPFPEALNPTDLAITGTELLLIDEYGERCAAFARDGRFLGLRDYPTMGRENLGWQNRLLNDDCFRKEQTYASFTDGTGAEFSQLVAFYDETDRIHALKEPCDELSAAAGHRLLTRNHGEDGGLSCVLSDLDAALRLGEILLHPSDVAGARWVEPCGAAIGEDWVLLAAGWCGEADARTYRVLFWYPDPAEEAPLEQEILDEPFFTERIAALKAELEALGLTLHLDEAPAPEQTPTTGLAVSESVCDVGASLFGQYRILSGLKAFADKLPAGFLRELYSGMPDSDTDRDSLHVYLVRNIPGDASAFANAWMEPMMVCFATEEYLPSQLPHEFMHLIDYRLNQYNAGVGRDLENEWSRLSPWWAYDSWLTDKQQQEVEGYFVSLYARTNSTEDRAETFQALFDSEEPVSEQWWYAEHPGVQAKAAYLVKAIRAAFPSVQAVEAACWEKLP